MTGQSSSRPSNRLGTSRLDRKLKAVLAGRATRSDFVIADAKDADMGFALGAPGPDGKGGYRNLEYYFAQVRQIVEQNLIDICLLSASSLERLVKADVFADTDVVVAVRTNGSTDIWNTRHASYLDEPSRPHRSVDLKRVRELGCGLGLYSMTFNGSCDHDLKTLDAFADFRRDALENGMQYFLEVFNPNASVKRTIRETGAFVNDSITRSLAPLMREERPRFLKIQYNGRESLRELVHYDDELVVGILGGSSGTTMDTLTLLTSSAECGAWVALFGRKINLSESPADIVRLMRGVLDGNLTPLEGVHEYHRTLAERDIKPHRLLEEDKTLTDPTLIAEA